MAGKPSLTPSQVAAARRRYEEEGQPLRQIAADMKVNTSTVRRWLLLSGVRLRTGKETGQRKDLSQISSEAWRNLYWGAASGYPGFKALGQRLGCAAGTVKYYLRLHRIPMRSHQEQIQKEIVCGRWKRDVRPPGYIRSAEHRRQNSERHKGKVVSAVARLRLSRAHRGRVPRFIVPCQWCGKTLDIPPFRRAACRIGPTCNHSCASSSGNFYRYKGEDTPRPVILQKLRAMLLDPQWRTMPRTAETLEKAGEPIGATDAEYAEIMAEWAQARAA